jgi:hypothetical protein
MPDFFGFNHALKRTAKKALASFRIAEIDTEGYGAKNPSGRWSGRVSLGRKRWKEAPRAITG